jgi:hypothetical protein
MNFEQIIENIRDNHGSNAAELVEGAAGDAWGAIKEAYQRGADIQGMTAARAAEMAARAFLDGSTDMEALAESIVRSVGLTPIRGRFGELDATR